MPAPTVTATSPTSNETGVTIQKRIQLTFSTAIKRSSVSDGSLVLYETDGGVPVPGKITFSDNNLIVYLLPTAELQPSFSYTVVAVGNADGLPGCIESSTSDKLASSYTLNFRTGTERFVPLEEVTGRTDIEHVAPIREYEELAQVTDVLAILDTTPDGFSTQQEPSAITIQFDEALPAGTPSSSWLTLEMTPILDYEDWYYGGTISSAKKLKIEDDTVSTAIPTGALSVSGDKLIWTKSSGTWPLNADVTVVLSKDIAGTTGAKLGKEVRIKFSTKMYPLFIGNNIMRLEVGPAVREFFDDTLNRLALWHSVQGWELAGREFGPSNPPYAAREYAKNAAVIGLMDALAVKAELARGSRKKLGDFEVDYSNRAIAKDSGKYLTCRKAMAAAEYKLRRWAKSLRPKMVTVGEDSPNGPVFFQGFRNWDNMLTSESLTIPAANWKGQRESQKSYDSGGSSGLGINPREIVSTFFGKFSGNPVSAYLNVYPNTSGLKGRVRNL